MVTIRPVERAPRTVSDEPVENEYTDLVKELQAERAKGNKLEAVIERDELPEGTEVKDVRLAINKTARTHGIPLNFKSAKGEWPIVFSISVPRPEKEEGADATVTAVAEAPKATGKAA